MFKRGFTLFFLLIATVTVAATLSLTVSVVQAQSESIEYFSADSASYTPGQTVRVTWWVTGATLIILDIRDRNYESRPTLSYSNLPQQGMLDITLPTNLVAGVDMTLSAGNRSSEGLYVNVITERLGLNANPLPLASACVPTFDFPGTQQSDCVPMRQGQMPAAYQPFENGFMIWRAGIGDVWAFSKTGAILYYPETVYGLLPDNPITAAPPSGRSAPANGFGRVWGNFPQVRTTLGWALGPEVSYASTVQYASEPFNSSYFFMTLPDHEVVRIHNGTRWAFAAP